MSNFYEYLSLKWDQMLSLMPFYLHHFIWTLITAAWPCWCVWFMTFIKERWRWPGFLVAPEELIQQALTYSKDTMAFKAQCLLSLWHQVNGRPTLALWVTEAPINEYTDTMLDSQRRCLVNSVIISWSVHYVKKLLHYIFKD